MTAQAVKGQLSGYQELIKEAAGVTDWQSREQLVLAAHEALQIITLV